MGDLGGMGRDVSREHDDNHAVVVMHQLLTLCVHGRPLFLVELGAGGSQQFVEARVFPKRVVLIGVCRVFEGHRAVRRRPVMLSSWTGSGCIDA